MFFASLPVLCLASGDADEASFVQLSESDIDDLHARNDSYTGALRNDSYTDANGMYDSDGLPQAGRSFRSPRTLRISEGGEEQGGAFYDAFYHG